MNAGDASSMTRPAPTSISGGRRARWGLWVGVSVVAFGLLSVVPSGSMGASHPQPQSFGTSSNGLRPALAVPTPAAISKNWSDVQVAFLLETTAYDGFYDPGASDPGSDPCAGSSSTAAVCEESNGGPVFEARAGQIAAAIAAAHPGTNVTFGLADYFATLTSFDDGDGSPFHVDVQNFTTSTSFQKAVNGSFRAKVLYNGWPYGDSDLSDNILHSSSITALYGALGSSGFNWSTSAHHVIVLITSTAPRAAGYAVNYSGSAEDYSAYCGAHCVTPTCEPSFNFSTTLASPSCEGWTVSQNGNASDSIAALAQNGTLCASSLGANCTVDTIALYNGVTDPLSKQWKTINGTNARGDSAHILNASCDLAAATGGSWDGPNFFTCPNGQKGTLNFTSFGTPYSPNTTNPSLLSALSSLSLGAPARGHPGFDHVGDLLITDQFNNRVVEVNPLNDKIVWSFGTGNPTLCNPGPRSVIAPNDAERLGNGMTLIAATGTVACPDNRVVVVSEQGRIVWKYGTAGMAGNASGLLNTPVAAIQLPNHDILITDQGNNRILEVNLSGVIVRSYGPTSGPGALNNPNSAERLANGDWLIADQGHNRTLEVNRGGHVVGQYRKGLDVVAFASRLPNGETLIADSGHNRIVGVNATGHVVLRYSTNLGPGSNPNPNPTRVVEMANGNLLITDQFNDRVIEVNASLKIVYQYGVTNVTGAGFDQLNTPYSAYAVGDFTGLTAPPARFL